jgi:integrase
MPRQAKGPRLWLQPARKRDDGTLERAVWVIRDGSTKRSTGAGPRELKQAETAFAAYILAKSKVSRVSNRDPSQVRIADVITIYSDDVAGKHARPLETAARLGKVLDHFGDATLDTINKKACIDYAAARGHKAAARRELEDLRAAIRHHWEGGLCSSLTPIVLPDRGQSRARWLTRDEAARLLWAARAVGHHVARFILVGLYTGTRAGAICGAALRPTEGRGWIDLEHGVFYRRATGALETKKRQPPVRLPPRLLAHLRRWKRLRLSSRSVVEWHGRPVLRINKAFRHARALAKLETDVTPHTLRHTCATWLAQAGVPTWEAAGFLGMTAEMFEKVYGHHHPDHQARAVNAFNRSPTVTDRYSVNEPRQSASNVIKIAGKH